MFSGGVGSWAAARRVRMKHGAQDMTLLFTDTLMEDEDLYRFIHEAADDIGVPLTRIAEGRTPWQVFNDVRFLGNSKMDPCSRILKREMVDNWLTANCDPTDTTVYVGIDWTEEHRYIRLAKIKAVAGWRYEAPLCEAPFQDKKDWFSDLELIGIEIPRLYKLGFAHNNCGGFCIKAGHGHYANLLEKLPERYAYHEQKEQDIRAYLGADVSMMSDRRGDNKKKPLTLRDLRIKIESGGKIDKYAIGGCGCFGEADE
jgi:hypothetical protein